MPVLHVEVSRCFSLQLFQKALPERGSCACHGKAGAEKCLGKQWFSRFISTERKIMEKCFSQLKRVFKVSLS